MTLEFLLTTIIAALVYTNGEIAASGVVRFARRLAGERGERSVRLATQAIRSVALGVVLTALIQAVLGGVGLAVAGVPFFVILSAVMFLLAIAQLGPLAVLLPAVIWLYWRGSSGWGTALLAWTVVVTPLDNILRPILIRKGLDLPLILIFAGVIGGLIAFGLVGIFVGPVILAVGHTLLVAWVVEAAPPSLEPE
jgi:predicted PurR-regulated permease PerM